jgi:uncharacterized membrane protein YphA (DoxX/SURF4 family)
MFTERGQSFSSTRPDFELAGLFKTISVLRIGAGLTLLWFHAWHGAIGAYQFLWNEQAWNWVDAFKTAGFPLPHITAPAAAIVVAAVAICWTLGFLTRLFAAVFIPVAIGALWMAKSLNSPQAEACWLYLFIAATLLLFGSGNVSLDGIFRFGAGLRPKKRKSTF